MWRSSVAAVVALLLSGCGPGRDSGGGEPSPGPAPGPGYPLNLAAVVLNHEDAFFTKRDRAQLLKDYDGNSKVRVWTQAADTGDGTLAEYTTPDDIGNFFNVLWQETQNDFERIESKLSTKVSAWFLCWRSIPRNFDRVTSTLVFDDTSLKIRIHNIVIVKPTASLTSVSHDVETKVSYVPPTDAAEAVARHETNLQGDLQDTGDRTKFISDYSEQTEIFWLLWEATPKLKEKEEHLGVVDLYQNELGEGPLAPDAFVQKNADVDSAFLQWQGTFSTATNTFVYDDQNRILFQTIATAGIGSATHVVV